METSQILRLLAQHPQVKTLSEAIRKPRLRSFHVGGLRSSSAALAFAAIAQKKAALPTMLFVLDDEDEAGYFYHDLVQMLGDERVLFFPSSYRRAIKYNQKDAGNEILRTEVLSRMTAESEPSLFIVSYPEAMAEKVLSKNELTDSTIIIRQGEEHDFKQLEDQLETLGFLRVDYVYEPGQYAVRGSIIDIYSFSSEVPYRLDFFGDEVDSIRTFDVQTQLSDGTVPEMVVVPEMTKRDESEYIPVMDFLPDDTVLVTKNLTFVCDKVEKTYREGYATQAVLEDKAMNMPEYEREEYVSSFGKSFHRKVVEPDVFRRGIAAMKRIDLGNEMASEKCLTPSPSPNGDGSRMCEKPILSTKYKEQSTTDSLHASQDSLHASRSTLHASHSTLHASHSESSVEFDIMAQPLFHKNFDLLKQECYRFLDEGYRIFILADSPKQIERLKEIFGSLERPIPFEPVQRTIHEGFVDHTLGICLFTDHQIFDRFHKYSLKSDKARKGKVALTLKEIQQFELGDYVVHIDHGIGKFCGLVRVPNGDTWQEMIKITYQNEDAVYVSIHALHKIAKYKGKEGEPPRISRLGSGAWERMKERVKNKVKDIARDLIKLYAARLKEKGFAYSKDSYLQQELEASFLYEDTPDQLKATQEVKADMEREQPMDRLVCGDVGFGKTEVAVRAAFKAAVDGKQTAVLVPTTVLAYQHYQTFSSRLKNLPVRVDYLSRARTTKEQTAIFKDLQDGKIDIIIGTHKLVGKQVKFKDLGLLVIDEEQKFGVSVKEKLRQMKVNVDTLTMTATPIPRTLQFSLMGARDLSVIQTPPPNRYPIQTEIHTFSAEVIAEAINFEMSRNGQVFFVNNKVSNLTDLKTLINRVVPDARVCIGHGQMDPKELEKIVFDFMNYDYDVLLSTTIVENGIDVPNANTIIINSAQNYGLSDLHQMRGRVGRGNKKAFCYLLAPPLSALPDEARRRLQAIENFSALGSGLNIAMQDLDIRGAGNMLGAEQSGFIADLGYETYQKVLGQAMNELKTTEFADLWKDDEEEGTENTAGTATENDAATAAENRKKVAYHINFVEETNVESDIPAYFSEQFVPSSGERMSLYKELDGLTTTQQIDDYKKRLIDRFGKIPQEGEELIRIVPLKWTACELGIERLMLKQKLMICHLVSNNDSLYYQSEAFGKLIHYASWHPRDCQLRDEKRRSLVIHHVKTIADALRILTEIKEGESV